MPDTVYVFGAGSTACLGMPTTEKQIELLENVDGSKFPLLSKLKKIVSELFGVKKDGKPNYSMNDIYNLIDSNLLLHNGLYSDDCYIEFGELENCKKELIAFIFAGMNEKIRSVADSEYEKFKNFYAKLAKKELGKKLNSGIDPSDKKFFISSYSVINFNWDLFSLLPILEAHDRLNHENDHYMPIGRNPHLRIFTDFNCEYAEAKNSGELWYPFTEQAAFLVNSPKYDTTRRVILTRCFYPHGAMNFFKCPHCAKHSFYLGDLNLRSVAEKMNYSEQKIYDCPYCGRQIFGIDFDILAQSNFKTRNSYLEEVRLSMINELRNAKRLVFIGYSMPKDDVDYTTMFKSLRNANEVYVVLKQDGWDKAFVSASDLKVDLQPQIREAVENFKNVFGSKDLYFNFSGAPDAFDAIVDLPDV